MGGLNTPDRITSPVTNGHGTTGNGPDAMTLFYAEVRPKSAFSIFLSSHRPGRVQITAIQDSIATYNNNIARISDLHSKTLNSTDEAANRQNAALLEDLADETRDLGNNIKQRLQALESQPAQAGQDMRIRKNRAS